MRFLIISVTVLLLASCRSSRKRAILHPDNLSSQFYAISSDRDTIIRTSKGAAVKITKGTFAEDVELEIKEAYTMKDMVLAGLSTYSNGRLLRSGGMIYINTRNKENVEVKQPIQVIIPATSVETDMQVFQGQESGDSINWIDPQPLDTTPVSAMIAAGKALYKSKCLSCHGIRKTLSGPALANFEKRGPWNNFNNVVKWIRSPARFIPTTEYTAFLHRQYGQIMTSFSTLTVTDIAAITAFVRNESAKAITDTFRMSPLRTVTDPGNTSNSGFSSTTTTPECFDTTYSFETDSAQLSTASVNAIWSDTSSLPWNDTSSTIWKNIDTSIIQSEAGIDRAYAFSLTSLGWYNIDRLLDEEPGTLLCEINVRVEGDVSKEGLSVYGFFPEIETLCYGVLKTDSLFHFDKYKDKLPLVLNSQGVVLVFGNNGNDLYYGTARFKVGEHQTVVITLQSTSEEDLIKAIRDEKIDGVNLDIKRPVMKVSPCGDTYPSTDTVAYRK